MPAALLASVLCAVLFTAAARAEPPAYDVRVLVDISGSMKKNDPQNLRRPALRLLADLLPDGARAGIWTFGGRVVADVPHAAVDDAWRQRAAAGIERVHSRGQYTDIESAVDAALRGWEGAGDGARRSLILLTDGVVDVSKDPLDSFQSRQRVLGEQLERVVASGAAVYSVALSARADHALLQELSAASGGWYQRAEEADQLQRIFLNLFEKTAPADTLPLDGDGFDVDASIDELTLLVFTPPGAAAPRLAPPTGEPWGVDDAPDGVRWRAGDSYALVTVPQPAAGHWRIVGEIDPDNRVMVVTDLRLAVDELPNLLLPGRSLRVAAELQQQGQRITREGFLELVAMPLQLNPPAGQPRQLALRDDGGGDDDAGRDGRFVARLLDTSVEGEYELLLRADGGSFQREHRHRFSVRWPVDVDSAALDGDSAGSYRVDVRPRAELLSPGSLRVSGELEYPDGRREALVASAGEQGVWSLRTPPVAAPGGHRVHLHTAAEWRRGERFALSLPPLALDSAEPQVASAPPPPDAQPAAEPPAAASPLDEREPAAEAAPVNWWLISAVVAALNVALIGVGWWLWRRRRRKLDELADLDGDDLLDPANQAAAESGTDRGGNAEAEGLAAAGVAAGATAGVAAAVDVAAGDGAEIESAAEGEAELELPADDEFDGLPIVPEMGGQAGGDDASALFETGDDDLLDDQLLAEMAADVDSLPLDEEVPGAGDDDGDAVDDGAAAPAGG